MSKPRALRRTKKRLLLSAVAVGTGAALLACGDSEDTNADSGTVYINDAGVPYEGSADAKGDHFVGTDGPLPYDAAADSPTDGQTDADAGDE